MEFVRHAKQSGMGTERYIGGVDASALRDGDTGVSTRMIGSVEASDMRLAHCRPTVRRAMASVAVFAACLAAVHASYRARLYGDTAAVKILPVADRTAEGMAGHARRSSSPGVLRRASLDPRLSALRRPIRAADPNAEIGSSPLPQVSAFVESVEDGTLWISSVAEGSAAEATLIARAVADAYIAEEGVNRVVPWTAVIPLRCEFHTRPLGEPWQLAAALVLAVLVSSVVLVGPLERLSLRQWMGLAVAVPIVSILAVELWEPFALVGGVVDLVVGAVVLAAFGVAAVRRPWLFLAIALVAWAGGPVMYHGFNAATLSGPGLRPGVDDRCSGGMDLKALLQGEAPSRMRRRAPGHDRQGCSEPKVAQCCGFR